MKHEKEQLQKQLNQQRQQQQQQQQQQQPVGQVAAAAAASSTMEVTVVEAPPEKVLAKDEMLVLRQLGIFPAKEAKGASEIFGKAKPREYTMTAEEEVAGACAKNDELSEAKANLATYSEMVKENTGKAGREHLLGVMQTQMEEAEKKVSSLDKSRSKGQAMLVRSHFGSSHFGSSHFGSGS